MTLHEKRIVKSTLETLNLWRASARSGKYEDLISDVIHVLNYLMKKEEDET